MTDPNGPHTPPASTPSQDDGRSPEGDAASPTPTPEPPSAPASDTTNASETPPAETSQASPGESPSGPGAEPSDVEAEPLPDSFADFSLSPALAHAVSQLGWTKPTPVQAKTFAPMIAGRDLLVQSRTGSGKTGAFCLPWLANRFVAGPARETGVQLLVMLPTRELAKQVCDELTRLAIESPVDVLAVYGGTAMGPQLDALRAGVHAVVGTPGRILDHVRRRSLDLSKVRTVVLDECDEMLSMGFLEDIRAILDACPKERQTCLFSATLPQDIVRIANRSMRDPVRIELSTGGVSASEIEHCAYILSGTSLKTHDLVDVLIEEDPAVAIIFCNTREETRFVAGVLQREGWPAEAISSDLTQAAREKVLQQMRDHELRFLVATDVAARGIDISHVSHVINFSFPETPESYVHRTGRTGRAGRRGVAISLIGPSEIGNFYTLRRQYPTIAMGERSLPSQEELAARRRETRLDKLSERFPDLVSPEWTQLARWLVADPRGERIIAFFLSEALAKPRARRSHEGDETPADREGSRPHPRDRDRDRDRRRRDDDDDYRSSRGRHRDRRDDRERGEPNRGEPNRGDSRRDRDERRPVGAEPRPGEAVAVEGTSATTAPDVAATARPAQSGERPARPPRPPRPPQAAPSSARPGSSEQHTAGDLPALEAVEPADAAEFEDGDDETTGDETEQGADGGDTPADGENGSVGTGAKRKRRRRRKKKPGAHGQTTTDNGTSPIPLTEAGVENATQTRSTGIDADGEPDGDDDGDDRDDGDESDEQGQAAGGTAAAGTGGGKKRRRRRRKKKPGETSGAASESAPQPERQPDRHIVDPAPVFTVVSQEEIILDIDEDELAEVRETFGEVDELDDLTLKARRRGVLDELQEEVVFEDLSAADLQRSQAARAARAAEDAADDAAEGDDEDDSDEDGERGDAAAQGTDAAGEDGDESGDAPKKKRRRRRKKKAPYVMPELVAPPHKDFWEVWASKFTREDFSDERFPLPADPEPPPAAARSSHRSNERGADRGERTERVERDVVVGGDAVVDERDYVRVELNLGREHGRKSADIRGLLADVTGLRGRSVRDLTVADRASYFRMPREMLDSAAGRLVGARDGDVELRLVEAPDAPVVLRADLTAPSASESVAAGEASASSQTAGDGAGQGQGEAPRLTNGLIVAAEAPVVDATPETPPAASVAAPATPPAPTPVAPTAETAEPPVLAEDSSTSS